MNNTFLKFSIASLLIIVSVTVNAQSNAASAIVSFGNEQYSKLNGSGIAFTPNKGQLADMNGKPCPDVLYKGDGGGSDIYLRKTGISYVQSNMGEVTQKINEQIEELIRANVLTEADKKNKQDELLQKEKVSIHRIDMDFQGANKDCRLVNEDELDGYQNFYYAHCPQGVTNVKQYNKVTYKNIYNGIDITYYGDKQNGIKYDLIVQPHADPKQIKLHWKGATELTLESSKLKVESSLGTMTETLPKVYQNINGKIVDVKAAYKLDVRCEMLDKRENKVGSKSHISCLKSHIYEISFELGTYNLELPLVIDPWASYYGGNNTDEGIAVTTDKIGDVIFIGNTNSINLPITVGASQSSLGSVGARDIFVVKMGNAGNRLWATYYGGTDAETAGGVTCDNIGNYMVSGGTASVNFPVSPSSHQPINGGGNEAFLIQFNSTGVMQWSTYYGGTSYDWSSDVVTNGTDVYLYGTTFSPNAISTGGSSQVAVSGGYDAFIAKFDASGNRIWGTYMGGSKSEHSTGIDCDISSGNIFITGYTNSANYPLLDPSGGAYFQSFGSCPFPNIGLGCGNNSYVSKLSSAGILLWSTYYGAANSGGDYAFGITVDFASNVIISGYTFSANFPVGSCCGNIVQQATGGGSKGFLVKFNGNGVRQWATFLGGSTKVQAYANAVDANNNIYFAGEFEDDNAGNYPISTCAYQTNFGGGTAPYPEDSFIAKYSPTGKQLCITYLGGSGEDDMENGGDKGGGITVYKNDLYITGITTGGYPVTPNAFQTIYAGPTVAHLYTGTGGGDAFIAQLCINICEAKTLDIAYTANTTNVCINSPVTFTPSVNNSCDTTGYRFDWTFTGGTPPVSDAVSPTVSFSGAGTHDVKLVVTTLCKKDSITKTNYITTTTCNVCNLAGQFTKGTATCSNCGCQEWVLVNAINGTPPYTYQWPDGYDKRYKNKLCSGNYTVKVTDKNGCSVDVSVSTP